MPAFSAQKTRKPHKKFQPRSFNLNLILWVSFSVFTIVVIAFFAVVQNVQIKYQYRAQTEQSLRDAGDEIVRYAETDDVFFQSVDLSRRLLAIANRYNVSVYLFTADGRFVFPEIPTEEQEEYAAIYEEVRSRLGEGDLVSPYDTGDGSYAHARRISLAGGEWYLYLSSSTEHVTRVMNEMGWLSLITGLFAVALAFVVSGLVSMVICGGARVRRQRARLDGHHQAHQRGRRKGEGARPRQLRSQLRERNIRLPRSQGALRIFEPCERGNFQSG